MYSKNRDRDILTIELLMVLPFSFQFNNKFFFARGSTTTGEWRDKDGHMAIV